MLIEIGATIRQRRKDLGLTQEDLAVLSGMSDRTLRDLEHGSKSPSIGALAAVCNALGITLISHSAEPPATKHHAGKCNDHLILRDVKS